MGRKQGSRASQRKAAKSFREKVEGIDAAENKALLKAGVLGFQLEGKTKEQKEARFKGLSTQQLRDAGVDDSTLNTIGRLTPEQQKLATANGIKQPALTAEGNVVEGGQSASAPLVTPAELRHEIKLEELNRADFDPQGRFGREQVNAFEADKLERSKLGSEEFWKQGGPSRFGVGGAASILIDELKEKRTKDILSEIQARTFAAIRNVLGPGADKIINDSGNLRRPSEGQTARKLFDKAFLAEQAKIDSMNVLNHSDARMFNKQTLIKNAALMNDASLAQIRLVKFDPDLSSAGVGGAIFYDVRRNVITSVDAGDDTHPLFVSDEGGLTVENTGRQFVYRDEVTTSARQANISGIVGLMSVYGAEEFANAPDVTKTERLDVLLPNGIIKDSIRSVLSGKDIEELRVERAEELENYGALHTMVLDKNGQVLPYYFDGKGLDPADEYELLVNTQEYKDSSGWNKLGSYINRQWDMGWKFAGESTTGKIAKSAVEGLTLWTKENLTRQDSSFGAATNVMLTSLSLGWRSVMEYSGTNNAMAELRQKELRSLRETRDRILAETGPEQDESGSFTPVSRETQLATLDKAIDRKEGQVKVLMGKNMQLNTAQEAQIRAMDNLFFAGLPRHEVVARRDRLSGVFLSEFTKPKEFLGKLQNFNIKGDGVKRQITFPDKLRWEGHEKMAGTMSGHFDRSAIDFAAEKDKTLDAQAGAQRKEALNLWESGDIDGAVDQMRDAHTSEDARINAPGKLSSYTWVRDPKAEEAFLRQYALLELQKGVPLSLDEVRRLKKVYENMWTEMVGEMIFDPLNLIPGVVTDKIFGTAFDAIGASGKAIREGLKEVPYIGYFARESTKTVAGNMANHVGDALFALNKSGVNNTDEMADLVTRLAGPVQDALDNPTKIAEIFANAVDEVPELVNINVRIFDEIVQSSKTFSPQQWVASYQEALLKATREADVITALRVTRDNPSKSEDWLNSAIKAAQSDAAANTKLTGQIANNHFSDSFKRAFLESEKLPDTQIFKDSLLGQAMKNENPFVQKIASNLSQGSNAIKQFWMTWILPLSPRWTITNQIDSTFRSFMNGGNFLDDTQSIFTGLGKDFADQFDVIPQELMQTFARNGLDFSDDIVARLLSGEAQGGAMSYVKRELRRLKAIKLGDEAVKSADDAQGLLNLKHPTSGILARSWNGLKTGSITNYKAAAGGMSDFNTAVEFTLRIKMFQREYYKVIKELEPSFISKVTGLVSPELKEVAEQIWRQSGSNPAKMRAYVQSITQGGPQGKFAWSMITPNSISKSVIGDTPASAQQFVQNVQGQLTKMIDDKLVRGEKLVGDDFREFFADFGRQFDEEHNILAKNTNKWNGTVNGGFGGNAGEVANRPIEAELHGSLANTPVKPLIVEAESDFRTRAIATKRILDGSDEHSISQLYDVAIGDTATIRTGEVVLDAKGQSIKGPLAKVVKDNDGNFIVELGPQFAETPVHLQKRALHTASVDLIWQKNQSFIEELRTFPGGRDEFHDSLRKMIDNPGEFAKVNQVQYDLVTQLVEEDRIMRSLLENLEGKRMGLEKFVSVTPPNLTERLDRFETIAAWERMLVFEEIAPPKNKASGLVKNNAHGRMAALARAVTDDPEVLSTIALFQDEFVRVGQDVMQYVIDVVPGPAAKKAGSVRNIAWNSAHAIQFRLNQFQTDAYNRISDLLEAGDRAGAKLLIDEFTENMTVNMLKQAGFTVKFDDLGVRIISLKSDAFGRNLSMSRTAQVQMWGRLFSPETQGRLSKPFIIDIPAHNQRVLIKEALVNTFGLPQGQAETVTAMFSARSKSWAKITGQKPEKYLEKLSFRGLTPEDIEGTGAKVFGNAGITQVDGRVVFFGLNDSASMDDIMQATGRMYADEILDMAPFNKETMENMDAFTKFLEKSTGQPIEGFGGLGWNDDHLKEFSAAFSKYLKEGSLGDTKLNKAFYQYKEWMTDVATSIEGREIELTDEVRNAFHRLYVDSMLEPVSTAPRTAKVLATEFGLDLDDEALQLVLNDYKRAEEIAALDPLAASEARGPEKAAQARFDELGRELQEAKRLEADNLRGGFGDLGFTDEATDPLKMSKAEWDNLPKEKDSLFVDLPGRDEPFEVFKNPGSKEFKELDRKYVEKFGKKAPDTITARHTIDELGNKYYWEAGESVHGELEPILNDVIGMDVNQNMSHSSIVRDALDRGESVSDVAAGNNAAKFEEFFPGQITKADEAAPAGRPVDEIMSELQEVRSELSKLHEITGSSTVSRWRQLEDFPLDEQEKFLKQYAKDQGIPLPERPVHWASHNAHVEEAWKGYQQLAGFEGMPKELVESPGAMKKHLLDEIKRSNDVEGNRRRLIQVEKFMGDMAGITSGPGYLKQFSGELNVALSDGVRQAMKHNQYVSDYYVNAKKALKEWEEYLVGLADNGGHPALVGLTDAQKLELENFAKVAGEDRLTLTDLAMNGGKHEGRTVQGALPEVNKVMLDYGDRSNFDDAISNILPFWMFPSRSLPMWAETMATNPELVSFYYKYQRMSDTARLQAGAVNSKGEPLQSLKGYIPIQIGDQSYWFNPLAPLSFRFALDAIDAMGEGGKKYQREREQGQSPWNYALREAMRQGASFGFNVAPWVTWALDAIPGTPNADKSKWAITPQMSLLMPKFLNDDMIRFTRAMSGESDNAFTALARGAQNIMSPDVSWHDYLVENRVYENIHQQLKSGQLTSTQASELLIEAEQMLLNYKTRDENPLWIKTRDEVYAEEYASNAFAFVTGFYPKQFSDAKGDMYALRNQRLLAKSAINDDRQAEIFDIKGSEIDRYESWVRHLGTPESQLYKMYTNSGWVKSGDIGASITDPAERRKYLAMSVQADVKQRNYYAKTQQAYDGYRSQTDSIPIGSGSAVWQMAYKEYGEEMTIISGNTQSGDYFGTNKSSEEIQLDIKEKWYRLIQGTKPVYDKAKFDTYAKYQTAVADWEERLPAIGNALYDIFVNSIEILEIEEKLHEDQTLGVVFGELAAMSSADGLNTWSLGKADIYDALNMAHKDLYWDPFWAANEDVSFLEQEFIQEEFKSPPTAEEYYEYIETIHPGKFTLEDVQRIIDRNGSATVDQRLDETFQKLTQDEKVTSVIRDKIALFGPGGEVSGPMFAEAERIQAGAADELRMFYKSNTAFLGQTERLVRLNEVIDQIIQNYKNQGTYVEPTWEMKAEWIEAQNSNEQFNQIIIDQIGGPINHLLGYYYGELSFSEKKEFRKTQPEEYAKIKVYYESKDAFAAVDTTWAKFYNLDELDEGARVTPQTIIDIPQSSKPMGWPESTHGEKTFAEVVGGPLLGSIQGLYTEGARLSPTTVSYLETIGETNKENAEWALFVKKTVALAKTYDPALNFVAE